MEAVRLDIEILTCGDSTSGLAFVDGLIWFCGVVQVVICTCECHCEWKLYGGMIVEVTLNS